MYLNHLKPEGFPNKIILVGDEQTHSILMNLKEQKNDIYEWLRLVPEDWHMLKLMVEVLCNAMWDCSEMWIRS